MTTVRKTTFAWCYLPGYKLDPQSGDCRQLLPGRMLNHPNRDFQDCEISDVTGVYPLEVAAIVRMQRLIKQSPQPPYWQACSQAGTHILTFCVAPQGQPPLFECRKSSNQDVGLLYSHCHCEIVSILGQVTCKDWVSHGQCRHAAVCQWCRHISHRRLVWHGRLSTRYSTLCRRSGSPHLGQAKRNEAGHT